MKIELTTVLLAVFLTLKLTHTVAWSWWWVLSPFWIPLAISGAPWVFACVVLLVAGEKWP